MKILLLCTTSGSVVTFRKSLIETLQKNNFEVSVVAFDGKNKELIRSRGVDFHVIEDENRSTNPLKILSLKRKYVKIIKEINPDIVFTFMMKPNIFGVSAAHKCGVKKIFSMVEGAGDVFINGGLKWRFIRSVVCRMYRKSFRYSKKIFFLNHDDKREFIACKIVTEEKSEIIPGIGVDIAHFSYKPVKNKNVVLMIARMLKTKGVMEYCQAARIVKQTYPDAVFNYLGGEGTLKVSDIKEYIDDGSVNYLGTTVDVRPYLEDCSVYVLPSYREGMPVSVMEAMSVGRAVVASDVPGCRETVIDGENGYLVPLGDAEAIADRIKRLFSEFEKTVEMGSKSRVLTEEKYDQDKINEKLLGYLI